MPSYFDAYSRYRNTQPIIYDGVQSIGMWNEPSWITNRPDKQFIRTFRVTPGYAGRPDLIAQTIYRNIYLDWVLVMFNHPIEVFGWPPVNTLIEYPVESLVLVEL